MKNIINTNFRNNNGNTTKLVLPAETPTAKLTPTFPPRTEEEADQLSIACSTEIQPLLSKFPNATWIGYNEKLIVKRIFEDDYWKISITNASDPKHVRVLEYSTSPSLTFRDVYVSLNWVFLDIGNWYINVNRPFSYYDNLNTQISEAIALIGSLN